MTQEEINKQAVGVLDRHPEVSEVYSTKDGNIFYKIQHAKAHAARTADEITTHSRNIEVAPEPEEVVIGSEKTETKPEEVVIESEECEIKPEEETSPGSKAKQEKPKVKTKKKAIKTTK